MLDIDRIEPVLDSFREISGITIAIFDTDGRVLFRSRHQAFCTRFQGVSGDECSICLKSDMFTPTAEATGTDCPHGLSRELFPLYVAGDRLADALICQFLAAPPCMDRFRKQAPVYGAETTEYMNALSRVPILSREKIAETVRFLSRLVAVALPRDQLARGRLRRTREKYKNLNQLLPESIFECDPRGTITYTNQNALKKFGYTIEDMAKGVSIFQLMTPFDRPRARDNALRILAGEDVGVVAYTARKKDGSEFPCILHAAAVFDAGRPCAVMGVLVDMTRRKATEEALRVQQERLNLALEATSDGIWDWHLPSGKVHFSQRYFTMLGYDPGELPGHIETWKRLIHPDDRYPVIRKLQAHVRRQKEDFEMEFRMKTKSDGWRWVLGRGKVVATDPAGTPVRMVGTHVDITARKQAEAEVRMSREQVYQAAKMVSLGTVVSGVAHEINNPLSFVMLNAPIMQRIWEGLTPVLDRCQASFGPIYAGDYAYPELKEEVPQLLGYIATGAKRIKKIVTDLKSYARETPLVLDEDVDVNESLQTAVGLVRNMIDKTTRLFSLRFGEKLPVIAGNSQHIEQVFVNLLINACQAVASPDHAISATTWRSRETGDVVVEIRDEGIGISPELLDRITDPFFTTRREQGGTGLGLSVSAGIVEDHGGRMIFTSRPGEGTIVQVRFPRHIQKEH